MIGSLVLLTVLSQTYNRSRVDDADSTSQCLWWLEKTTVVFHQNEAGNPETLGLEFAAIAKSFATWQAQQDQCGSLTFEEGARTSSRSVGYSSTGSNENIVVFRQKSCTGTVSATDACWKDDDCGNLYDCWQFSSSAIAITTTSYNPTSGRILDSDIELNTPSFVFTTVDSPVCPTGKYKINCVATDVQNTATHEIGHLQGLAHISLASSTMSAHADPGELTKRALDPGSKQFVCDVYPKGLPTQTCFTPPLSTTLGKAAGCSEAPAQTLALLSLLVLVARRRAR